MRKVFLSILIAFSSLLSFSQDTSGVWAIQPLIAPDYSSYDGLNLKGVRITILWRQVKPTEAGPYQWTSLLSMINQAVAKGWFMSLQTRVGPESPDWIFDKCGYFTTNATGSFNKFPKYYSPEYKIESEKFMRDFSIFLSNLNQQQRAVVLSWQVSEGSTGDIGAFKGQLDPQYIGDPYVPQVAAGMDWINYRRSLWGFAENLLDSLNISNHFALAFNAGNTGQDGGYIRSTFSNQPIEPWIKEGNASHVYGFPGERAYAYRLKPFTMGESEGEIYQSTYKKKDAFVLMASAINHNLNVFNISPPFVTTIVGPGETSLDPKLVEFYNKFINTKMSGFSLPSWRIDYSDTVGFPVSIFGEVINPTKVSQYQTALANLWQQTVDLQADSGYYNFQIPTVLKNYINPSRKNLIDNWATNKGAQDMPGGSMWDNDFTLDALVNYEKNLYQIDANATSQPDNNIHTFLQNLDTHLRVALLSRWSTRTMSYKWDADSMGILVCLHQFYLLLSICTVHL